MPSVSGDRSAHFPAIERKHGQPVEYWLQLLAELGTTRYPDMMALLQEGHGFSRTHANALVQWARGSTSTQRFAGPEAYFEDLDPAARATAQAIFTVITSSFPHLQLVMAWNQPMLRCEAGYVFGLSVASKHLTINPFSTSVLDAMRDRLAEYTVNKHTFTVPIGWTVDAELLHDLVAARLACLSDSSLSDDGPGN